MVNELELLLVEANERYRIGQVIKSPKNGKQYTIKESIFINHEKGTISCNCYLYYGGKWAEIVKDVEQVKTINNYELY